MNVFAIALIAAAVAWPVVAAERSPIESPEMGTNSSPEEVATAKDRGAKTATKDIKTGELRILYFGQPWSNGKPLVDETTGYRVQIVGGCVVTKAFVTEVEAYNDTMRAWHAKAKKAEPSQKPSAAGPPFARQGDKIVDAPEADLKVARSYSDFKDKGTVSNGRRITIMTAETEYEIGEEVRVIHVLEATEEGLEVFVMGPKTVDEEYVDDKLAAQQGPDNGVYDGRVMRGPAVDSNYEITSYCFTEQGMHTIQWRGGGFSVAHGVGMSGSIGLRSNTIRIHIKPKA